MLLWLLAIVTHWPSALSFGDEVGYIGQIKLFLAGRVHPTLDSPGVWAHSSRGIVPQFPLALPLLLTPLFAAWPRLVFASGVAAALALTWMASRTLKTWGRQPLWALGLLVHPTVAILARTVMADLLLASFAVGGWYALGRGRRAPAIVLLALTVATKPTGFLLVFALLVGEMAKLRLLAPAEREARPPRIGWCAAGLLAGLAVAMTCNMIAAGRLWYGYEHGFLGTPPFWPTYFPRNAPLMIGALLLLPPLLLAGAQPYWRRRELGPLLVIAGLPFMMSFYFFIDRGRSFGESLVLAPRLIMPSVAFLLIGYADVVGGLVQRAPSLRRVAIGAMVVVPGVVSLLVSIRHQRWQQPKAAALASAIDETRRLGATNLGLTIGAVKAGMLFPGPTTMLWDDETPRTAVVLCGTEAFSYRNPDETLPCKVPGYADRVVAPGFHLFVPPAKAP
jgi:hypothetical protein